MTVTSDEAVRAATRPGAGCVSRGPFVDDSSTVSAASWWESAACRSVQADLFCVPDGIPPRRRRERERQAKAICRSCLVRVQCLDEALNRDEQHGVWGGLDAKERKALKRQR